MRVFYFIMFMFWGVPWTKHCLVWWCEEILELDKQIRKYKRKHAKVRV